MEEGGTKPANWVHDKHWENGFFCEISNTGDKDSAGVFEITVLIGESGDKLGVQRHAQWLHGV